MNIAVVKALKETFEKTSIKAILEVYLDDGKIFKVTQITIPHEKSPVVFFRISDKILLIVAPERIHHIIIGLPDSKTFGFQLEKSFSEQKTASPK